MSTRATQQAGRAADRQMVEAGLTRPMVRRAAREGRIIRRPGKVWAIGHLADCPDARWHEALLAVPGSVLSHRSAAVVWGLLPDDRGPVHVIAPHRHVRIDGVVLHLDSLDPRRDVRRRRGLAVVEPMRAIQTLAAVAPPSVVAAAIDEADVKGWLHPTAVERLLHLVHGKRGARAVRAALADRDLGRGVPRQRLERRWRRFAREWSLPPYERGTLVDIGGGELRERDVVFPGTVLGIELDGGATHGTHKARRRDRRRDRRLAAGGRITLRVGWEDMVDPVLERELAEDVLRLLGFEARADAISDGREHPVRRHR